MNVPDLGVELAGTVEFADDVGMDALGTELVRGNGERGASEFVPVEPKLDVLFKLWLGVRLEGPVTVELAEDGETDALGMELVRGKGERGASEFVPVEPKLEVLLDIWLDVRLAGGVTVELAEDWETDALATELVMWNAGGGLSEFVTVEPTLDVMFELELGVILGGGAVTVEFTGGTIEPLAE